MARKKLTIEQLAKMLHESGHEAVMQNKVLKKSEEPIVFIDWSALPEDAKEGRRMQVKYLLSRGVMHE